MTVGDIFAITNKLRRLLSLPVERESSILPPADWPTRGDLKVDGLTMRYRPELPPVLKNVSCTVHAGERIGIVGRTGAGKSSFVTALFRLVEADSGVVSLDGVDIAGLNLQALRGRIAIITQDPVMIHGTIRYNLDPFGCCDDAQIGEVLDICQLTEFVTSLESGLDYVIDSSGNNISLGQKQQFSMARALLKKPKLLVLDEATSSIDNKTDVLIQRALDRVSKDITMLIIAHR